MIILSWDIGIKYLAYCMFKYNNESFNIIYWDSINLSKNFIEKKKYYCNYKDKKKCCKLANIKLTYDENIYFFVMTTLINLLFVIIVIFVLNVIINHMFFLLILMYIFATNIQKCI